MTALLGTFVNVKTMADGTPRLVLDLQCTLAEIAALGLIPGTPFGIARITGTASMKTVEPVVEASAEKIGSLCVLACRWCKDPNFWKFAEVSDEAGAKRWILDACQVDSRRSLDTFDFAADLFHKFVRKPFMCWKAAQ